MKRITVLALALFVSASIFSQRNNNANYWNSWTYKAKDGMVDEFMAAAAKKTAMFNTTDETAIITYRIATGPNSGSFVRVEANKKPADYDLDRSAEGAYWNENVSQYIAEDGGQKRWIRLNDGSYTPSSVSGPAKIVQRTTFSVKADKIMHFRRFLARVAQVIEKRGGTASRSLYRLQSGGNRNEFVLAVGFDTYERQGPRVEHENSFSEDYNEMFGYGTYDEDGDNYDAALEYWGEMRETLVLVPEMSTGLMGN